MTPEPRKLSLCSSATATAWLLLLGLAMTGPSWSQDTEPSDPGDDDELPDQRFSGEAVQPWEEYSKFIQARSTLSTQGPTLFGDDVNLYNGALSFAVTDIDLPGNSALPVQLRRVMAVGEDANDAIDPSMGGWGLDLPNVSGVYGGTAWPAARCSNPNPPTVVVPGNTSYNADDYWQGLLANLPAGGGEMLVPATGASRPTTGGPYRWVTQGFTWFECLPSILNGAGAGAGEGFVAITADGTKYWFNWMAQFAVTPLKTPVIWHPSPNPLSRKRNTLYATRVEDRFGNWVTYTYTNAWNQPVRLQSIQANDGRQITITYEGERLKTATAHGRPWTYEYTNNWLTELVLPDNSRWTFDIQNLVTAKIQYQNNEGQRFCETPAQAMPNQQWSGSITHPSGAQATFVVRPQELGRSQVPMICLHYNQPGVPLSAQVPRHQNSFYGLAIRQKTLTGPGLTTMNWIYAYASNSTWACAGLPNCPTPPSDAGVCHDESCATGRSTTDVQGPGEWTRYRFGNTYRYDEGLLRQVDKGTSANQILETVTTTYNLAQSGQLYPTPLGTSPRSRGDGWIERYLRPRLSNQITRQWTTFTWEVLNACFSKSTAVPCFDHYARPTQVSKFNSLAYSKTESIAYHDNTTKWVLGQIASIREGTTGPFIEQTTYDGTTALPTHRYAFGKLMERRTYHTNDPQNGLPNEIYDGSNIKKTTLTDYHRGIPRRVDFHDGTYQRAGVNDRGEIAWVEDERRHTTEYEHDPMGRIQLIKYPTGDQTSWTNTSLTFTQVNSVEYGLSAGHWRLTRSTGAHQHVTYFDGLWRPVLTREYDSGNETGTRRMVQRKFNHRGQEIFASYPLANIAAWNSTVSGTTTIYDALGRPASRSAASELGDLTTSYEYLGNFHIKVTNPRGQTTTTRFLAFDQPVTDYPFIIQENPQGITTTIFRDHHGKALEIARAGGGQSATRTFVYDTHQRLCKTIDPESGASMQGYDASGNVEWTATGINAPSTIDCQYGNASAAQRSVRTHNDRNRLEFINHPDGTPDTSFSYHPNGQLWTTTNDGSTWTYGYDKRGNLRTETLAIDGFSFVFTHGYTNLGHRASLQYPDGTLANYQPNALGQPTRTGTWATNATWHRNGALAGFTYGNAITHNQSLNARQLPWVQSDSAVLDYTLTWDPNGNLAKVVGTGAGSADSGTMVYDDRDRLTRVHLKPGDNPPPEENYVYDALDHLRQTRFGVGSTALVFDYDIQASSNRLNQINVSKGGSSYPGYNFTYDTRGNMTSRGINGSHSHAYDAANRMLWANTGSVESYRYDGHGRRTWINRPGGNTYQVYGLDGKFLYERAPNGTVTKHLYLGNRRVASVEGSTTRYHHINHLGSVIATSNAAGTVTASESYASYGSPWDGTYTQGPGYTGHVTDAASGLSYMQQRYYDPVAMRFVSPDPVYVDTASGGNFNRYWYANNNPYTFIDPDGRDACPGRSTLGCIRADSYEASRSTGQTAQASESVANAMVAGKDVVAVANGGTEEKVGFVMPNDNGGHEVRLASDATTSSTSGNDSATASVPTDAVAVIHGHIDGQSHGLVSPGDAGTLTQGLPNGVVSEGRVGVTEIVNGRLQFRMLKGRMTKDESRGLQRSLNRQQRRPEFMRPESDP